jgi:hypothetical protein
MRRRKENRRERRKERKREEKRKKGGKKEKRGEEIWPLVNSTAVNATNLVDGLPCVCLGCNGMGKRRRRRREKKRGKEKEGEKSGKEEEIWPLVNSTAMNATNLVDGLP